MTRTRTRPYVAVLTLSLLTLDLAWSAAPASGKKSDAPQKDARSLELKLRRTIALLRNADASADSIEPAPIWERPHEAERDRRNLELNLRWIITRLRSTDKHEPATVGVYADAGAWHVGARSIVKALEDAKIRCRVLDCSCLTERQLEKLDAIVMPGGWSVFQKATAGKSGLGAVRNFVENGGKYLGVCAGAYLAAKDVRWQGQTYPYPLILFDGIAEGSLPAVARWPKAGGVRVKVTAAGRRRGIGLVDRQVFLYKGGPRFVGGTNVAVLAEFPDGSAAVIARPFGKGEVVLTGPHFERPPPEVGDEDAPVPDVAGELLKSLLFGPSEDVAESSSEQSVDGSKIKLFDMDAIRDPSALQVDILQDWHEVEGPVPTRQKLVTINVGEMWPGQDYRMPVRMVVPADRKARGFHLTGGNHPRRLRQDTKLNPIEQELAKGGVGLVYTVVQELRQSGLGELGAASEARFLKTLNPHDKIQYWAWPATMMRAVTTAYAETDHFGVGKVAMSGGSKNGATPSMAILHDQRMTAVHAAASPIWDSPLRLCDRQAWDEREAVTGPLQHTFLGGHFGPNYNRGALAAGHRWEDLQKLARDISDGVFITRNIEALRTRDVDLLFHPGTHDFVAYDIAWGGKHHPDIPIYLRANSGHGQRKGHPAAEQDEQNRAAFLLEHFFDEVEPLLEAPTVQHRVVDDTLKVTVRFKPDSGEESGRIWWIYDRAPDGSPGYISGLIPNENWADMEHDRDRGVWAATIDLDANATRIDFFSNHRKSIHYHGKDTSLALTHASNYALGSDIESDCGANSE